MTGFGNGRPKVADHETRPEVYNPPACEHTLGSRFLAVLRNRISAIPKTSPPSG